MQDCREVAIIGSGPAGYTAALYAARAQLAPIVFEGSQAGGALMNTTDVENFPGFPDGVLGPELMTRIRGQAERFGAELVSDDVVALELAGDEKAVRTHNVQIAARTVILAMGSAYRRLGVPGEAELSGRGVSWCATCDGFFFKDQDIVVVGGGDTAMEEATFLTRFAKSVTVVHRRAELRASRVMVDRAKADPKIRWQLDSTVARIHGDDAVTGIVLGPEPDRSHRELSVTGVFVAIGHEPRSDLVRGQVELDPSGYVVTRGGTRTSVDGVFAAGDLVDHTYRQAITAAGSGCRAALDVERHLAGRHMTVSVRQ
jgi:thioredoxin reductase (NADPH)